MLFLIYISLLIIQRLSELTLAKSNEKWMRAQGAIEYGREHYPYIVALHTLFFVSMIAEYFWRGGPAIVWLALVLVVLVMSFKFWALTSLGKYWNTKILRVPGASPVIRGPYKFLKHPNYMEVIAEIALIPLVFQLYYTAILFTVLNAVMLYVRISVENRVWRSA